MHKSKIFAVIYLVFFILLAANLIWMLNQILDKGTDKNLFDGILFICLVYFVICYIVMIICLIGIAITTKSRAARILCILGIFLKTLGLIGAIVALASKEYQYYYRPYNGPYNDRSQNN